jgi:hypothetical protein
MENECAQVKQIYQKYINKKPGFPEFLIVIYTLMTTLFTENQPENISNFRRDKPVKRGIGTETRKSDIPYEYTNGPAAMAHSGGLKASGTTGAQECTPVFTDINQKKMFAASALRSPDGCFSWAEFGNLLHRTGAGIQKKRPVKIASES